jgi:predicted lipoprotein with Yx(FWY)xxD motif
MKHRSRAATAVVLVAAGIVAALLATSHARAAQTSAQVNMHQTALGRILVDSKGRTLYLFAPDKHGKSTCYGQCATFWPPLIATKAAHTGAGLQASLFGTTVRKGGQVQVTYDKHPLYRFAEDAKAGQAKGQGLNAAGGLWWVVSPAGSAITKKAAPIGYP